MAQASGHWHCSMAPTEGGFSQCHLPSGPVQSKVTAPVSDEMGLRQYIEGITLARSDSPRAKGLLVWSVTWGCSQDPLHRLGVKVKCYLLDQSINNIDKGDCEMPLR